MADSGENFLGSHVARMLTSKVTLTGTELDRLHLIIEKLLENLSDGHSCMKVTDAEKVLLLRSSLAGEGELAPLVVIGNLLYLYRYYTYERQLAERIGGMAAEDLSVEAAEMTGELWFQTLELNEKQQDAVNLGLRKALVIVSGGPGTGKTSTVVAIISAQLQVMGTSTRIALCAPTGKAAARLGQAVQESLTRMRLSEAIYRAIPEKAQTLHRLLGVRRNSPRFRHDGNNPLPWDLVVVDEASMVDLALMSKFIVALRPGARLVLLGDKDQLASVESGAVLTELSESLPGNTVVLEQSYRFDGAIKEFAEAIKSGDGDAAWRLIEASKNELELLTSESEAYLLGKYRHYLESINGIEYSRYTCVFERFNAFRILCAMRRGSKGMENVNLYMEHQLKKYFGFSGVWYPGRPVMITRNDYNLGLYNGDIGICLPARAGGGFRVWFVSEEGKMRSYLPSRLPEHSLAYSITIHKSQGSEFDEIAVLLPPEDTPVLCREILYTAITRARKKVMLQCDEALFKLAVARKTSRFSGLAHMIAQL